MLKRIVSGIILTLLLTGMLTLVRAGISGRNIDVFTQYPYPHGGQGPHEPSEAFAPQDEVILYANVTYNDWPVQSVSVVFTVSDSEDEFLTLLTDTTNENGVAQVSLRIPSTDVFGSWSVLATVQLADEVCSDTLTFEVANLWLNRAVESCDSTGVRKDLFNFGETPYVNGSGFLPSTAYSLHIVNDQSTWTDGEPIPPRIQNTTTTVSSDLMGVISPIPVWSPPLTPGTYDIVLDIVGNGIYDYGVDVLDDDSVFVTIPGDVNADRKVDTEDMFMIALHCGCNSGDTCYMPNYDVNGDDKINIEDIFIAATHYGETW